MTRRLVIQGLLVLALSAMMLAACGGASNPAHASDPGQAAAGAPVVPTRATIPAGRRGINGASQARCTPAPCSYPAGPTTFTLSGVSNGDGTSATRQYAVLRPGGLVPSPSNRAPAVLTFYASGNCGYHLPGHWADLAAPKRFVVVALEVSCSGQPENWRKRNIGSLRPAVPSDEPYVAAVVRAIERCPGECVDPKRVYAVGESGGGSMVADVMCDPHNSALFRGYMIDSSTLSLYRGVPSCPTTNVGFVVMLALSNYAADRGVYYDTAPHPHLDVRHFASWAVHRLRCRGGIVTGHNGTALSYSNAGPCAFVRRGAAVIALGVINGGHGWNCQDSYPGAGGNPCPGMPSPPGLAPNGLPNTGGLFVEGTFWRMVATGIS